MKKLEKDKPVKIEDIKLELTQTETRVLLILIEERMRTSDKIVDIKGLCKMHDKVEEALSKVVPF